MPQFVNNSELQQLALQAGGNSELTTGRKMRDWTFYHYKDFYGTTGQNGVGRGVTLDPTIEYFRNPQGSRKAVTNYEIVTGQEYHNIITSAKADEPMLVTSLAVRVDVGKYHWQTTESGQTIDHYSSDDERFYDYSNILKSGRFVLKVNNQEVADYAPIGILGERVALDSTGLNNFYSKIAPLQIAPYILMEEGITVTAEILFEKAFVCSCPVRIGVEIICFKFFKA